MKRSLMSLGFLAISAVTHAEEHAAAGHHEAAAHGIPTMPLIYAAINFALLLLLLTYFLRKPLKEFFASRSVSLGRAIDEAQDLKRHAESAHQEYLVKLQGIETEIQQLNASLESEGKLERDKLVQTAQQQSRTLRLTSEKIIQQEVAKAKEELKRQAVALATELAENLVRKQITPEDQKRLMGQYLEKMERMS